VLGVNTWYDYQAVWANHRWVLAYAVIVVAVIVLAVIGTVLQYGILELLFIPALAGAYAHHVMVMRRLPNSE
jgi:hypothetical protein